MSVNGHFSILIPFYLELSLALSPILQGTLEFAIPRWWGLSSWFDVDVNGDVCRVWFILLLQRNITVHRGSLGWKDARTSFPLRVSTFCYICSVACSSVEGRNWIPCALYLVLSNIVTHLFFFSVKQMTFVLLCSLWDMCNSEHSHICQVCVPLLLHCISLPSGSDVFWKVIQEEFHNTDWRVRFVAGMYN